MIQPVRLQRTRRRNAVTPHGAVYVGRPSLWGNPFARPGIAHARGVILYASWLRGEVGPSILSRLRFGLEEADSLSRWRRRLVERLPELRGRNLQCWCPLTSQWCHADTLLRVANHSELAA